MKEMDFILKKKKSNGVNLGRPLEKFKTCKHGARQRAAERVGTNQDDQTDKLSVSSLASFTGNDIPLLWCADNNLGSVDLLFTQLMITGQLSHSDSICR